MFAHLYKEGSCFYSFCGGATCYKTNKNSYSQIQFETFVLIPLTRTFIKYMIQENLF
jgi:hypothetical protein